MPAFTVYISPGVRETEKQSCPVLRGGAASGSSSSNTGRSVCRGVCISHRRENPHGVLSGATPALPRQLLAKLRRPPRPGHRLQHAILKVGVPSLTEEKCVYIRGDYGERTGCWLAEGGI